MEWLLLIGCIGMKCIFGSTQVSLPSQEECQKLSDQFTGSYGPDQPMYFSKCFGTANAYSGDKGRAWLCNIGPDAERLSSCGQRPLSDYGGQTMSERRILPQRRESETFNVRIWNQDFTVTVSRFEDGALGEVFVSGAKTGQDIESTARDVAILLSLAFQHGMKLETIQHAVSRSSKGDPSAIIGAIVDALTETMIPAGQAVSS